jgi:hypothetical protein
LVLDRAMAMVEQPFDILGERRAAEVTHQLLNLGMLLAGSRLPRSMPG